MDTVWQHARMYGYRRPLLPYTRVYLPRRVAARFKGIHQAEEELRNVLRREAAGEDVLVRVAVSTRATRPNATEPAVLRVVGAGLDQLFPWHLVEDRAVAARILQILRGAQVPIGVGDRVNRATSIPLDLVFELVNTVPIDEDDPGRWTSGSISALMESFRDKYQGQGTVYVRGLQNEPPPDGGWTRGRLSGPEITLIRAAAREAPALALMYLGEAEQPRAWYPTLVLPEDTPTYILNPE